MSAQNGESPERRSTLRILTMTGLLVGGSGIAVLWAAGVDFPVAVPPGLVILLAGAAVVAFVRRPWAVGLGAFLGLFVTVGFLVSPTGLDNLSGDSGAAVAAGQAIQLVGVLMALVAGALAFRSERRRAHVGPATGVR
ncbi:hypothetical protein ACPPVT_20475 [Angustibacter sp. McL0619]|uniref:hypothetical protein n=1 Tax=Angustibacter sp. McL0619 TaxID=3415676 RepID=UPI003CEFD2B4